MLNALRQIGRKAGKKEPVKKDVPQALCTQLSSEAPFYHGGMPREVVEGSLSAQGDFVLRLTLTNHSNPAASHIALVLSFFHASKAHHSYLREENGAWTTDDVNRAPSVLALIELHRHKPVHDLCILRHGVPRPPLLLRHTDICTGQLLGSGKFGHVFRGTLAVTSSEGARNITEVVVKISKKKVMTDKERGELHKEALLLAEVAHDRIVKCHGLSMDVMPVSIVMELCEQGCLSKHLRRSPQAMEKKLTWCWDLAEAMNFLIEHRVLHRDLGARNCLLDAQERLKLADFGMAVRLPPGQHEYQTDCRICAVRWTAPEAMCGTWSEAADVFAYGVFVFEVVKDGKLPWEGYGPDAVARKVQDGERLTFGSSARVPPVLLDLVQNGCWVKNPGSRPSFATILSHLRPVLLDALRCRTCPDSHINHHHHVELARQLSPSPPRQQQQMMPAVPFTASEPSPSL